MARILAIASNKGGVGKTTVAVELAYSLEAVLVDLDYDAGGATGGWPEVGNLAPEWARRSLIDGDGPGPRVVRRPGLPDLIPSHGHYGLAQLAPELVSERLEGWGGRLDRDLVVDTHPGYQPLAIGAMAAAHLTLIPVVLEERVMHSFLALLPELRGYRLAAIPYRIPRWGAYHVAGVAAIFERLLEAGREFGVPIGPAVSEWRDWPRRRVNRALQDAGNPGQWVTQAQGEFRDLTEWVRGQLNA